MPAQLDFLGASKNVTGSSYLFETGDTRIIIDCGMYQERQFLARNWAPFPVPAGTIDAVVISHAHLDHVGRIPRLYMEGFRGRIYCTRATAEIARVILLDAARIQEEDAAYKKRRHEREGRRGPYPEEPLYTTDDVMACLPLFTPVAYGQKVDLPSNVELDLQNAGHVLGSAVVRLRYRDGAEDRTLICSGDLGRWDKPMLPNPTIIARADYVLVESTYGDRLHENAESISRQLAEVVNSTVRAGGKVIIPAFALERAQELLYYLHGLLKTGVIPRIPVYLDSPMACRITDIFDEHPDLFDGDIAAMFRRKDSPFEFPGMACTKSVDDSKAINNLAGPAIIIAGAGMATGGRIKHHLVNYIGCPECTVLFVGYQAVGTLGRQIADGAKQVRILGQQYAVRARVSALHGLSAHADRDELMRWLRGFAPPPRRTFVIHGEAEAAASFAAHIKAQLGWNVTAPDYVERVTLD